MIEISVIDNSNRSVKTHSVEPLTKKKLITDLTNLKKFYF